MTPERTLDELAAEIPSVAGGDREDERWAKRPLSELVDHILTRYHAPLKAQIPLLIELAARVEREHADKPDRPIGLTTHLVDVRGAVDAHLAKEEQILFPLIASGRGRTAYMPVQVMIQEHEDHGDNLRRIRALTNDLTLPDHACATWRELYQLLAKLEVELKEHIHLENNVLFPRALAE